MNKNHKRCNRLGLWGAPIPHSMQKAICLGLWRLCISFLLPAAPQQGSSDLIRLLSLREIVGIPSLDQQLSTENTQIRGFLGSTAGKEIACNAGVPGLSPGSESSSGEWISCPLQHSWTSLVAQMLNNLPAMWENWV